MIFLVIKGQQTDEVWFDLNRIPLIKSEFHDGYTYAWVSDEYLNLIRRWFISNGSLLWFRHIPDEPNIA